MTRYSQEFKDQAVKLSDNFGLKKAADQLGISVNTLACCHACVLSRLRVVTLACWRQKKKRMPDGKSFVFSEREKELATSKNRIFLSEVIATAERLKVLGASRLLF